ncbi:MAG: soluble lytic murein transglycosylase-like protein [Gammaproteobacteria bacterium]
MRLVTNNIRQTCSKLSRRILIATILCLIIGQIQAEVLVYEKPDGSVLITDRPVEQKGFSLKKRYGTSKSSAIIPLPKSSSIAKKLNPANVIKIKTKTRRLSPIISRYDSLIRQISMHVKLEESLLKAVIHAESAFNARAVSHKGAIGLMQLMPTTARAYGVQNSMDPAQNMAGGSKHLRDLLDYYDNNTSLALAAYNAGKGAVRRYRGVPPYRETENYILKVMTLNQLYKSE